MSDETIISTQSREGPAPSQNFIHEFIAEDIAPGGRFAGMQGSFDGNCSTGSGAVSGTVGRAGSAFCTGRLTVCGSKDRFSSGLVCS